MIELYSLNVEVPQNGSIPLNNISIAKGTTAVHSAPATVQLNKKGIYMVSFNGSITPTAAGTVSVQLAKDFFLVGLKQLDLLGFLGVLFL